MRALKRRALFAVISPELLIWNLGTASAWNKYLRSLWMKCWPDWAVALICAMSNSIKAKSLLSFLSRLLKYGSSDWTRTSDIRINSPPFYRLNYRGIVWTRRILARVVRLVKGVNTFVCSFADKISKAAIFPSFYAFAPFWCVSTSSRAAWMRYLGVQNDLSPLLLLTLRGFNRKTPF